MNVSVRGSSVLFALLVGSPHGSAADCNQLKHVTIPGSISPRDTQTCSYGLVVFGQVILQGAVTCPGYEVFEDSAFCVASPNTHCKPLPPSHHYLIVPFCNYGLFSSICDSKIVLLGTLENYTTQKCLKPPPLS
jgi:hypothetical protein